MKHVGTRGDPQSIRSVSDSRYFNTSVSGTIALDASKFDEFDLTLTGNTTLSFTSVPSGTGRSYVAYVIIRQGATAFTLTHAANYTLIKSGTTTPTPPSASKRSDFVYESINGGSSWDLFEGPST